jgi:hypothetical protein
MSLGHKNLHLNGPLAADGGRVMVGHTVRWPLERFHVNLSNGLRIPGTLMLTCFVTAHSDSVAIACRYWPPREILYSDCTSSPIPSTERVAVRIQYRYCTNLEVLAWGHARIPVLSLSRYQGLITI